MSGQKAKIQIRSGEKGTYPLRYLLREHDFIFRKTGKYSGYWEKLADQSEMQQWKQFCKSHGLQIRVIDPCYERSNDYRKIFFQNYRHSYQNGKIYQCVYCGRFVSKDKITVDHLFPVSEAAKNAGIRRVMRFFGIKNTNDTNNLVPACHSCNEKKGRKMGIWLIKGCLGRHLSFWICIWIIQIIICVLIVSGAINYFR